MSFTTNKNLVLPAHGSDVNTWDVPLNSNATILDGALGGVLHINVTSLSSTPINMTSGLSDTYSYIKPIILVAGTLTANVTFVIPSGIGGEWIIKNSTTGAFTLTFSSGGAGTSVTITQGTTQYIYSDGTNINFGVTTSIANNSITNTLLVQAAAFTLKGNPTGSTANVQDAALTAYLDNIGSTQGSVLYRGASTWSTLSPGTIGQVLSTGGVGVNPFWGTTSAIPNVVTYLTAGPFTFTVPLTVSRIWVTVVGAGGGGGASGSTRAGAGGGGISIGIFSGLTGGTMISGTVGAGGVGSTGGTGGTTTFGAFLSATGGSGGVGFSGGAVGTGSGGYLNLNGSAGQIPIISSNVPGNGGNSYGAGGNNNAANGQLGGGGAGSGSSFNGGTGGDGGVIIYY